MVDANYHRFRISNLLNLLITLKVRSWNPCGTFYSNFIQKENICICVTRFCKYRNSFIIQTRFKTCSSFVSIAFREILSFKILVSHHLTIILRYQRILSTKTNSSIRYSTKVWKTSPWIRQKVFRPLFPSQWRSYFVPTPILCTHSSAALIIAYFVLLRAFVFAVIIASCTFVSIPFRPNVPFLFLSPLTCDRTHFIQFLRFRHFRSRTKSAVMLTDKIADSWSGRVIESETEG